jgi:charged multivesicular body protein 4
MNFFGRKKKDATPTTATKKSAPAANNPQETIVKLREVINQQDKREEHIQKKIDTLVNTAKTKMAAGDKKGALFAMKQKKMHESEIDKINNTKMTLETQVMNLESAVQNKETFSAMKTGTGAMQTIRKEMDIEKVDEMMDDIREEMEIANEISNAIAQPVDFMPVDEDELLAELQELEVQDTEAELLKRPTAGKESELDLPSVPTSRLPAKKKSAKEQEEEEALKELQAMMS